TEELAVTVYRFIERTRQADRSYGFTLEKLGNTYRFTVHVIENEFNSLLPTLKIGVLALLGRMIDIDVDNYEKTTAHTLALAFHDSESHDVPGATTGQENGLVLPSRSYIFAHHGCFLARIKFSRSSARVVSGGIRCPCRHSRRSGSLDS